VGLCFRLQGADAAQAPRGTKRKAPDSTKQLRVLIGMAKPIRRQPGMYHSTRVLDGKNVYAFSCEPTCACRQARKKFFGHAIFNSKEEALRAYREQLAHLRSSASPDYAEPVG